LSLAEAEKGVREILFFHKKFLNKNVIKKAYQATKKTAFMKTQFSSDP
jgi:hypothetical protein